MTVKMWRKVFRQKKQDKSSFSQWCIQFPHGLKNKQASILSCYVIYLGPLSTERIRTELKANGTESLGEGLVCPEVETNDGQPVVRGMP